MMYDVTGLPLAQPWFPRGWVSSTGNTGFKVENQDFGGKTPSHLLTKHVIWGLHHVMTSLTVSQRYCQTTAILKWRGVQIGAIYIVRRTQRGLDSDHGSSNDILQLAQDVNTGVSSDERIVVTIGFVDASPPIERRIIYLTTVKALGDAAEKGLDLPILSLITQGLQRVSWKIAGGSAMTPGVLRPRHSRFAIVKTVARMIEDQRFQKAIVLITVDGLTAGAGGFFQDS